MLALKERKLMKRVARVDQQQLAETDQFDAISSTLIFDKANLNSEAITEAERQVAENLQLDAIWVSFYWDTLENPIGYRYSLTLSKEDIALIDDRNKRRKFSAESELFGETEQKPKSYLSLYVRPKGDVTPSQPELEEMRRVFVEGLELLKASATAV